jgi:hypothetical protein
VLDDEPDFDLGGDRVSVGEDVDVLVLVVEAVDVRVTTIVLVVKTELVVVFDGANV